MNDANNQFDFLVIGEVKCATTWIYQCLKEHPEVNIISLKAHPFPSYFLGPDSIEDGQFYKNFFQKDNKVKGEVCENYLYSANKGTLKKIKEHNSNIKLIALLRNPIKRAWSQYVAGKSAKQTTWKDFEDASRKNKKIIERGYYYKNLKKFTESFSRSQIKVLWFQNLKQDPVIFAQEAYRFLGVDDDFVPKSAKTKISSTAFKITTLGKITHRKIIPLFKNLGIAQKLKSSYLFRKLFYKLGTFYVKITNTEKPQIPDRVKDRLINIYRKDIKNLEQLLNCNLERWYKHERR